jgi:hypothetical protein
MGRQNKARRALKKRAGRRKLPFIQQQKHPTFWGSVYQMFRPRNREPWQRGEH